MQTFVHATEPIGWFVFRNPKTPIEPSIITPVYNKTKPDGSLDPVSGQDLHRLGYQQGKVVREGNQITYHQKGYGDFSYDVTVCWKQEGETLYGTLERHLFLIRRASFRKGRSRPATRSKA